RVRKCNLTPQIVAHCPAGHFSPLTWRKKLAAMPALFFETLVIGEILGASALLPLYGEKMAAAR
ncbi:hypothetical protein, partial [Mesorhizobium captivum]